MGKRFTELSILRLSSPLPALMMADSVDAAASVTAFRAPTLMNGLVELPPAEIESLVDVPLIVTVSAPTAGSIVSADELVVLMVRLEPALVIVVVFAPVGVTLMSSGPGVPKTVMLFAPASTL